MSRPLIASALFALSVTVLAAAPSAWSADAPTSGVRAQEKEESLEKLMSKMGKHFKALKKNVVKTDKKEANIKDFTGIAECAQKCKASVPETAKTEEDKKKYADMMEEVAVAAKAGAKAAQEGKTDEAKKSFDDLKKMMGEGHKKFKPETK